MCSGDVPEVHDDMAAVGCGQGTRLTHGHQLGQLSVQMVCFLGGQGNVQWLGNTSEVQHQSGPFLGRSLFGHVLQRTMTPGPVPTTFTLS